jgi:hypothetical protein
VRSAPLLAGLKAGVADRPLELPPPGWGRHGRRLAPKRNAEVQERDTRITRLGASWLLLDYCYTALPPS